MPADTDLRDHHASMRGSKSKIDDIKTHIGPNSKISYIDYPSHFNIGDLLIGMGAEAFFRRNNVDVVGRYTIGDLGKYDEVADRFSLGRHIGELDDDVAAGTLLVFHGGGNLGDMWPHHQRAREALLERYKGVKAVVLPQSIHFKDERKRDAAARLFQAHGDVTVYVRDEESYRFVSEYAQVPGEMMPDMAHYLWDDAQAFPYPRREGQGTLLQTRDDTEGSGQYPKGKAFDWDDVITPADWLAYNAFSAWRRLNPVPRAVPSYKAWYSIRDRIVRKGVERFQPFAHVETDRLHGLILSALLGKTVHFDDTQNRYRKLNRYYQKWLADSPLISAA